MGVNKRTLDLAGQQHDETGALLDANTAAVTTVWESAQAEGMAVISAWADLWADASEERGTRASMRNAARTLNLQRTIAQASDFLSLGMGQARAGALDVLPRAAHLGPAHTGALARAQLPARMALRGWQAVDPVALQAIVKRSTQHITVRHYYLETQARQAMRAELRLAVATGDNPRTAARRMVQRAEGVFNGGRARAEVIARTEVLDAYRAASMEALRANRTLTHSWQWYCALSSRTCPSCLQQHGSIHDASEDGPQDHHQGRCTAIPIVDLRAAGLSGEPPAVALKPGDGVRWFERQPKATQAEILGPARFRSYSAGKYPAGSWSKRVHSEDWRDAWHVTDIPGSKVLA